MIRRTPLILVAAIIMLMGSCIKDELNMDKFSKRMELTPGLAIPVGYGNLTVRDLLKKFDTTGGIRTGNDSLLYLAYSTDFLSFPASAIFTLPDQLYNQFFIKSDYSVPIVDSVVLSKSQDYAFALGKDEKIDSMVVKSGKIVYTFRSSFRNTAAIAIQSDFITKNGHPYSQRFNIGNTTGDFQASFEYDISGSTIRFKRSSDSSFIPIDFKLTLFQSSFPVRVNDSVNVDLVFSNLDYHIVYGNVGYKNFLNETSSISVNLFNPSVKGSIDFANPEFNIKVKNSFGIPMKINLTNVSAYSEKNNITTNITFPPDENPVTILCPDINQIGRSQETNITFNNIVPTMADVIKTDPSKFDLTVSGYSDTTSHQIQFITDTSNLKATMEVNLPMWFRAGDFAFEDTVAFDLQNLIGIKNFTPEMIKDVFMRLVVDNGMPLDVKMQVYFADAGYQVLDSMFTDNTPQVPSGVLNADYRVVQKTQKMNDVEIDNAKISRIKDAKWAFVKAAITTTQYAQNPSLKVKFYSDYTLHFELYLKSVVKLTENNF